MRKIGHEDVANLNLWQLHTLAPGQNNVHVHCILDQITNEDLWDSLMQGMYLQVLFM